MNDLKNKTLRGGFAKLCAQAATVAIRVGSLMVLARLLDPKDFGLVGMVTALMGVLNLFKDFGLSTATIQRSTVSDEQISTLFWINIIVGLVLGVLSIGLAPLVVAFYHEPSLFWVTVVLSFAFLFNAAGVQHLAILQRQLRFTTTAVIEIISLLISVAAGIAMAGLGYGYWALVVMTIVGPLVSTAGAWLTTAWIPGFPQRNIGIRSMMRFGGTVTLNGLIVYVAYNLDKVFLGRYWGAEVIGIYGRAYQLVSIPTNNLNSAIGEVAFSALARLQDDAARLKSYFLKGYALVLALTLPITVFCAVYADELIFVLLGPKWHDASDIFRLLAPTILVFALINPLGWLLFSTGMVERSLKVALILAPLVITGYLTGLPYGPRGVAIGYSTVMALWVIPHIIWCVRGTVVSVGDIVKAASPPMISGLVAAGVAIGLQVHPGQVLAPFARLLLGGSMGLGAYLVMLLVVMNQRRFYVRLFRGLIGSAPLVEEESVACHGN